MTPQSPSRYTATHRQKFYEIAQWMAANERPQHPPYSNPVVNELVEQLLNNAERGQKLLTENWSERAERMEQERELEEVTQ